LITNVLFKNRRIEVLVALNILDSAAKGLYLKSNGASDGARNNRNLCGGQAASRSG
jgi:hypothetical protein